MIEKSGKINFYFEQKIDHSSQFGKYAIVFRNPDRATKDVTFALKSSKKLPNSQQQSSQPSDSENEEDSIFSLLNQVNQEFGHFITENKFQNFR